MILKTPRSKIKNFNKKRNSAEKRKFSQTLDSDHEEKSSKAKKNEEVDKQKAESIWSKFLDDVKDTKSNRPNIVKSEIMTKNSTLNVILKQVDALKYLGLS